MAKSFKISVTDDFTKFLSNDFAKQVPYATAQSLNEVAFKARKAFQTELQSDFKLHGNFIQNSVVVIKATKASPIATVGILDRASFLLKQETGGTVGPSNGRDNITIAEDGTPKNSNNIVAKSNRPLAQINKKNTFKKGNVLFKRVGKGIVALWTFIKSAHYQPKMHFEATMYKSAKDYPDIFLKQLLKALK